MSVEVTDVLGGLMLLCAFALLSQARPAAMISLYQAEALALAAAALWQGFVQSSDDLYLTGLITLAVKTIALPIVLRRFAPRRAAAPALPAGLVLLLGVALIGVAVLAVPPIRMNAVSTTREELALSLSVILLGLAMMTTRRDALAQVIGFLSTENGLVLAAIFLPGLPFVAALSVALLLLPAFLVLGLFLARRAEFAAPDLAGREDSERLGR